MIQLPEFRLCHEELVEGGDVDEGGRPVLRDLAGNVLGVPRVGDQNLSPAEVVAHLVDEKARDVKERIARERRTLTLLPAEPCSDDQDIGHGVAVGEHRPLGGAGGAAGVLDVGDIVGRYLYRGVLVVEILRPDDLLHRVDGLAGKRRYLAGRELLEELPEHPLNRGRNPPMLATTTSLSLGSSGAIFVRRAAKIASSVTRPFASESLS